MKGKKRKCGWRGEEKHREKSRGGIKAIYSREREKKKLEKRKMRGGEIEKAEEIRRGI